MRSAAATRAGARIRSRRILALLTVPAVLAGAFGWWVLTGRGELSGGAVPALLAAGGWGLGLIPVHADWRATGPSRRRTAEPAAHRGTGPPEG
ncbi:hypothetical protein ACFCX4_05660 [Kitasatospora sp. NPDC056327]|uniref:hypothetical protein n=1 Tax=Kitasatospora sp. NPDC056327 TaxID=3345785 RepID=UPI0035E0E55E